jgi:hypothetical protein
LKHSHFPVSFGWFDKILTSPHMHQVHHSSLEPLPRLAELRATANLLNRINLIPLSPAPFAKIFRFPVW